jgi:FAD-dependent monooxygenase
VAAHARGVPLKLAALPDATIAERYGCALALVRPDGHIAWRGDTAPADPGALIDCVRGAVSGRACAATTDRMTASGG